MEDRQDRKPTKATPVIEALLTPAEAARLLSVSVHTLYTWAGRHQIPVQRVGRCLRFSPAALRKWLARQARAVSA